MSAISDQPRIAIVHEYLTRMGGAERTAKVLADLFPEAPVYTLLYDRAKVGAAFPPWRVHASGLHRFPRFLRNRPKFLLPWITQAVESWDFSEYDIVISSSSAFAHGILTGLETRHICYCHSPARFLWDWTHEYAKENNLTGIKGFAAASYLRYLREWNRLAAGRVDRWVANSETVAKRISKYYRVEAEVVHPPVEVEQIKMGPREHQNYFLIVSQLTPYKKIDRAISVFNKLRRRLVIVGDGPQRDYLQQIAGPTVELLGWQSDAAVHELLRHCRGFILPGEEDFGIAPVEALAAGRPVLALNRGGATETIIDGKTGVLFPEPTAESLEAGLALFFANEKNFQPALLRAQAKRFSRQLFEERMRKVVNLEWQQILKNRQNEARSAQVR